LERTLKAIHHVGVLHGDLRLPNMLENGPGGVAIIDFNSAVLDPSPEACSIELKAFSKILP